MAAGFATSTAVLSSAAPVVSSPVKPTDIVKHYGHFAEATVKEPEKNRTMAELHTGRIAVIENNGTTRRLNYKSRYQKEKRNKTYANSNETTFPKRVNVTPESRIASCAIIFTRRRVPHALLLACARFFAHVELNQEVIRADGAGVWRFYPEIVDEANSRATSCAISTRMRTNRFFYWPWAQEAELTGNILLHLKLHHIERTIHGA
ncbi:uncharacterized protein LOC114253999 isoform X2 [Monomorium pharaonis]|uniref:uncharacterized protein LOC114253999 isoform X2 n=1 Tax=Monomorium pharaonis TaxID=307658 RepID=UPI001746FBAC|nr:uncharacterized protein LOC114253999 isoform X2 [Monomorium pharaonis]